MYKLKGLVVTLKGLQPQFEQLFQDDEWSLVQTKSKELSESKMIVSIEPVRMSMSEHNDLLLQEFSTQAKALGDC